MPVFIHVDTLTILNVPKNICQCHLYLLYLVALEKKLPFNESLVKDELEMYPPAFSSGNLDNHVKVM